MCLESARMQTYGGPQHETRPQLSGLHRPAALLQGMLHDEMNLWITSCQLSCFVTWLLNTMDLLSLLSASSMDSD